MSTGNLEQIREVFLKARELAPVERRAYLDQAWGGNADLRREVEQLLAADEDKTLAATGGSPAKGLPKGRTPPLDAGSFPVASLPDGYRFMRELGRGGQAVVCAAVQESTGRTVAIKIMRDGPLANASSRSRFDREAQLLAALRHPHIVTVLDRGVAADTSQYIVMDYIKGLTLTDWLRHRSGQRTKTEDGGLLRLFIKICSAINAAHLRGIVHRDIKPSNILIDERGEPYVLDFGLARPVFDPHGTDAPMTLTGQFLGSLPWASPEQAEGDPDKIDTRTDVYALGVVLYQLLTCGQFPYEVAGNMRDVLNNILTAEPAPPSRVMAARQAKEQQKRRAHRPSPPTVNAVIESIVLKTLSKRRDDRYQTAGELEREVTYYLAGLPTIAGGQKILKQRGRERLVVGAMFAVALAVVGVISWTVASRHGRQPNALSRSGAPTDAQRSLVRTSRTANEAAGGAQRTTFTNSIGMKFIRIEPGEFIMGSPPTEQGRLGDETQHRVKLTKAFYMGVTPVAQAQWKAVMGNNPSQWKGDDLPAECVTWGEAVEFCGRLSEKEGKHYRLPTEAEFEYACRAGTTTPYCAGGSVADLSKVAWFADNSGDAALDSQQISDTTTDWAHYAQRVLANNCRTHPVGSRGPNAWGLFDVHGNVQQWCADWYGEYPGDATDPTGPAEGASRVSRGSSWIDFPRGTCRAACRKNHAPGQRHPALGVRLCCEATVAANVDTKRG